LNDGVADYLTRHGFASVRDLVGALQLNSPPAPVATVPG